MSTDVDLSIELCREHSWNLDMTLASVLDQGLTFLLTGPAEQDADMERARDIFRRYASKFENGMEHHLYRMDSDASKDLTWALSWLTDNFRGLWD